MKIKVNPNRMELLRLRRRLMLAQRGHRLLEDKLEDLMRKFLKIIEEARGLREVVEGRLKVIYGYFINASMLTLDKDLGLALSLSPFQLNLEVSFQRVMNLELPQFSLKEIPKIFNYSPISASGELDFALKELGELLPDLIRLAQLENNLKILALEIERTRRRVNALEYVVMPNIEETIRDIKMRLSEIERSNLTRLMRVKEIVRAH